MGRTRRGGGRAPAAMLLVAALACGGGAGPSSPPPAGAPSPGGPPSAAELEALYRARTDSALARYTPADAEFMAHMIAHHRQALDMARLAPSRSADAQVQRLAARITTGQEAEIDLMRRWLEDRGLRADAFEHRHDMPGMLTPEQMQELERARGTDFDRLFLLYMIRHHEGALVMVDELFATPGAAQGVSTFRIASGVQVDQRSEIARMQSMLESLNPARPRP